jgi:hypothetical protein
MCQRTTTKPENNISVQDNSILQVLLLYTHGIALVKHCICNIPVQVAQNFKILLTAIQFREQGTCNAITFFNKRSLLLPDAGFFTRYGNMMVQVI